MENGLKHGKAHALVWTALAFVLLASHAALAQESTVSGPVGTVTLARPEYDRLLDLAAKRPPAPERPPVRFALTSGTALIAVDDAVARATITVQGEIFEPGAMKIPMLGRTTILDARLGTGPMVLVADEKTLAGIVTGPGPFTATLDWAAPLSTAPGRASFVLPVPPAGSVTASIDVPGDDVRVTPGVMLARMTSGGRTVVDVTLVPGSHTNVSWSIRESPPAGPVRGVRLLSDVKTLITLAEAEVRLLSIVDLTVVQGVPESVDILIPSGYEVTGVTGTSIDRSQPVAGGLRVVLRTPPPSRQQILVSLERAIEGGTFTFHTGFPSIPAAQRETGEVAIEGIGPLDVAARDAPVLRRVDVREVAGALASAARQPLLAAFRYPAGTAAAPALSLDVTRFADAALLPAGAERAVATTLITSEGRTLTEISLSIRNRAQAFMSVALPEGASVLSVEVAGAPARPARGPDGARIPLLRPGFRPTGTYNVSFVYLHAGPRLDKRGDMQLVLPRLDLPIAIAEWELFVPDRYRADRFSGNVLPAELVERYGGMHTGTGAGGTAGGMAGSGAGLPGIAPPGRIYGRIADSAGVAIAGAKVAVVVGGRTQSAITDVNGWYALDGVPSGRATVTAQVPGFRTSRQVMTFDQRPQQVDLRLEAGSIEETVVVSAEAVEGQSAARDQLQRRERQPGNEPSLNVQSLQRRAAGILPIRIDVPRAGTSHRFVKPLVVDEEVVVGFRYRHR